MLVFYESHLSCICAIVSNVTRCAIWYLLYNLKNLKNTHGGMLLLVKLQAKSLFLSLPNGNHLQWMQKNMKVEIKLLSRMGIIGTYIIESINSMVQSCCTKLSFFIMHRFTVCIGKNDNLMNQFNEATGYRGVTTIKAFVFENTRHDIKKCLDYWEKWKTMYQINYI